MNLDRVKLDRVKEELFPPCKSTYCFLDLAPLWDKEFGIWVGRLLKDEKASFTDSLYYATTETKRRHGRTQHSINLRLQKRGLLIDDPEIEQLEDKSLVTSDILIAIEAVTEKAPLYKNFSDEKRRLFFAASVYDLCQRGPYELSKAPPREITKFVRAAREKVTKALG